MNGDQVVILGAKRTPLGAFGGELAQTASPELGGAAIRGAFEAATADPSVITEVYMGCVLPAGLGQAPARQAALSAGLRQSTPCTTVNKMCGSGMKAVMLACDGLAARSEGLAIAGGMESMSRAPYLLQRAQGRMSFGHRTLTDHMLLDGLEDAYEPSRHMGTYAEDAASEYQFSREEQDKFALETLLNTRKAISEGAFDAEIAAVEVTSRQGTKQVEKDEAPGRSDPDKIPLLKPAFRQGGTVTAANSSSISDGAAALVLGRSTFADMVGIPVRASIVAGAGHAHEPSKFTTAPVQAIRNVLDMAGWTLGSVDLFEINEAFAVVPMIAMRDLGIPREIVNRHGGACALGHPIGASGARILVTLLHALERYDLKRGVAAICLGGGEGLAVAIER